MRAFVVGLGLVAVLVCVGCGDSGGAENLGGAGSGGSLGGGPLGGGNLGGGGADPSGDKQPSCGDECMVNYSCGTEALAACGDALNNTVCETDSECAGVSNGAYCYAPCGVCTPACTMPAECESFEDCVEGRCVGSCVDDADCPANFGCVAEGTGKTCLRKSCDTDADCDGYCVLHQCQSALGACVCEGC